MKKKRLLNGFDLALIALVLIAALGWFFLTNRTEAVEETHFTGDTAWFYLEVPNLNAWQASLVSVGDQLQENTRHVPLGEVYALEVRPQETRVDNHETQTISLEEIPDRYTLIITVQTNVEVTERELLAEGQVVVRGGSTIHIGGPGYAFGHCIILGWSRD